LVKNLSAHDREGSDMHLAWPYIFLTLVAGLFACVPMAIAQSSSRSTHRPIDSTATPATDSVEATSYAYTLLAAEALAADADHVAWFGSLSYHASSAMMGTGGTSGFATLGANFFDEGMMINGAVGAELIRGRFSFGVSGGVAFVIPWPVPFPYLDGAIGYEMPVADGVGMRVQCGPILFLGNREQAVLLRANLGIAMR
jgi:hypothetical protein